MMNEVTDSSLIAELEGNNSGLKPVDDPALIQELEGMPQKTTASIDTELYYTAPPKPKSMFELLGEFAENPLHFTNSKIYNLASDYFEDPQKEAAKATEAIMLSETFEDPKGLGRGITFSTAYDYADQIKKGLNINPVAANLHSTFKDRVKQAWDVGNKQSEIGMLGYEFIKSGNPEILDMIKKIQMPTEEETFIPKNTLEEAVMSAAQMLPYTAGTIKEGGVKGAALGMGFATMAALAKQPEFVIPAWKMGLVVGSTVGAFEYVMKVEAGNAVNEILNFKDEAGNSIDTKTARIAALAYGLPAAALEVASVKILLNTIPGAKDIFKKSALEMMQNTGFKQKIFQTLAGYTKTVAQETGIEITQELNQIAVEEFTKIFNNNVKGTDIKTSDAEQIISRVKEITEQAALGMAVVAAPGSIMQMMPSKTKQTTKETTPDIGLIEGEGIKTEQVSPIKQPIKQTEAIKPQEAKITTEQPVKTEELQLSDLEKMFEEDKSPEEFMQMLEGKETEALTSEAISELPLKEALLKEPSAEKQEAPALYPDRAKLDEIFSKDIDFLTPEEAKIQLTHDQLTGLKNRRVFDKQTTPVTGIIDLDNFKRGNDVFGHEKMDEFLKDLGENLKQEGLYDIVTRLHGDEFGAKVMSNEHALEVRDAFNRALQKSGMVVELVSGNKYLYQGGGASYGFDKDIKFADKALYEDKKIRQRAGLRGTGDFPESVSFTPETEWEKLSWREVQSREVEGRRRQLSFLKDWLRTKEGPQKLKNKEGAVVYQGKSDREQIFQDLSKEYKYSYDQIQKLLDRAINDKPLIDKPKTPASLEKATQFIEDILAETKDFYAKSEGGFLTSPETKTFKPKPIQQDMIGAKTGLEGKLPSEEIKGKTDLEVATEQAQIREAQKGQGDIILESGGLQTLYETLMKKAKVPETAYSDLVELGKYVYDKGGHTASSWMKGMKEHLGKLWDTYKEFLTKVWNEIKKFVGNEKGFVRFGKEQPGDIKLSELDKQDELFKVGILEAYKAGKEAYKAGLKTGIQKEHAKIMELQKQKKLHEAIKAEAKDMVNDIKDIQENIKNTHPIAADAITKVLDSVDLSNISENKRAELEPLYAYYKSQEGMQIPENLIKPLSNLDKKPIKDLTLDELRDIHSAVMEAAKLGEKLERQEATYENVINRLSKIKPSVAVSYQKMIKETLVDFDPKKMSEQTMQELQKTKDYLDNVNPEEIGMSQETYSKLKKSTERLNKKRLADMTLDEKKELAETLQRLNAQGKVMRQLELARRERTKQELLKTLLDDTSTLDPKKDTTFRKGGKELYQKTLTSYRVADNIDNFIEGGINKQFIADQLIKETESDYTSYEQNAKFIEKAKAIKPEWTEEEQQRVVVKALDIMDAKTQRDMLIEELGMKEIPILTEVENKLLLLVEETMNQNKHDISATFEYRENQIFPEIKRYIFPLKYEAQKNLVNAEILRHDYHKTKQVDDYFTEQRAKGVKKLIRTDLFNIVRQSLEEQNWYINMQPTLDTQASVLFTKEYKVKAGEMGYNWWKDQIDIVARRGYSAKSDTMFRNGEKYLKEKRINLNNAIMTYKVSSAVMQIFSVFDGMATALALQKPGAAATMIPNVIAAWLKKPEIIKMSKALQMRTGGEQALREIVDQGFKNKLTEWGYVPLKNADLRTASGVMKSFYNSLEGKGADKIQQAELLMALSQGGNAISLRPHILASGEIARTAFTFQTFFLNRWGLVANDIINRGIIHGDTKTKSYAVAALATIIAGSILEDEARDALWSLISGKKQKKEVAPVKKVLANLIETVPLAGRAMSSTIQGRRGDTDVPIVRLGKQGFGGIWDVLSKEKSKDKVKGAIKAIEMILSVRYGMPATAQIMDFIEGAMNDRK